MIHNTVIKYLDQMNQRTLIFYLILCFYGSIVSVNYIIKNSFLNIYMILKTNYCIINKNGCF